MTPITALGSRYGIQGALGRSVKRASTGFDKTSLIAWWTMDETSGTRYDSHGSNDLSDGNTVGYGTGIKSNAADFEYTSGNEHLYAASNSELQMGGTDFTITFWVKVESFAASSGNWFVNKRGNTDNLEYQVYSQKATGAPRFGTWDSLGNADYLSPTTAITTGEWHFIVASFNNTSKLKSISMDNETPTTTTLTGVTIPSGTAQMAIGNASWNPTANLAHDGMIDEVAIWKRVLTADEITWLYNSGAGRTYTDL